MSRWDSNYGNPNEGYQNMDSYYSGNNHNSRFAQPTYYPMEARNPANNNANSQGNNSTQHNHSSNNYIDVTNSNLQATATEFRPSSSSQRNNGAVKKRRNQSRTFNNQEYTVERDQMHRVERDKVNRVEHRAERDKANRVERDKGNKVERDKVVRETADILNKLNVNEKRDSGDNQSENARRNHYVKPRGGFRNNYYKENWYPKKRNEKWGENWRQNKEQKRDNFAKASYRDEKFQSKPAQLKKKLDAASQRERLEQMVTHRMLECLVCCEKLRHTDKVWSCQQCYHILHLNCVQKWAKSSKLESGWRCPACQNVCTEIPNEYFCYCGKFADPKLEPGSLAHSCGEICGRKGRRCEHACTLLCHPGPCPDCNIIVSRSCGCGATKPTVKCSSDLVIACKNVCGKLLNCQVHTCMETCHPDECNECLEFVQLLCHCGQEEKHIQCAQGVKENVKYECGKTCGKMLTCTNHTCEKLCHAGDCGSCPADPKFIKTCCCGQTALATERLSCLDPIPCCDKICNKRLKCGQPSDPHLCKENCHEGDCPTCPLSTFVRCRCGHMDRELACKELKTKADDARCQKKCTKKRSCCKHKCNQMCCIELEHDCPLPCNRLLSCGLHKCEQTCHRGRCATCWRTSFDELYCECGSSVLYPPVACGTRPPPCNKPCSRQRTCGHESNHSCHSGACPLCTVFTKRWCHGQHESRLTIPCYQQDFSCGMPCGKEMSCGKHKCNQICHKGNCPTPCTQPCAKIRPNCDHTCGQPCHENSCPNVPCRQNVTVTCQCGLRTSSRSCMDLAGDYQNIVMAQLASKMADIQRGQSVDINDIVNKTRKGISHKTLECNDECRLVERNRRLAIGLQIRNPDLSSKLTPRYSDYMRNWVKKDSKFCQLVHDKLTELVQLAKQSKQKSRSFSFDCMNREKRHFVHEYCEHFGCDSAAYDKEPNRNVVATAFRDKSWLPSVSVIELLQRESGQRKVPGPVLNKSDSNKSSGVKPNESVSLRLQTRSIRPSTPPGETLDYFDNPPTYMKHNVI